MSTASKIENLLKWAETHKPDRPSKSPWAALAPVVSKLEAGGWTVREAIKELVKKGAISAEKERSAYHAILQFRKRQAAAAK